MKNNKFEITTKQNKINQWLEINCPEAPNQHIQNMLSAMKKDKNIFYIADEELYIFNTVGLSTIKNFIKVNKNVKSLIKLFKEAISLQEKSINYLVPTEAIIFDLNYSYINHKNDKLELIILPIDNNQNNYSFNSWMEDILKLLDKSADKDLQDFINKVFNEINKSNFCLNSFKDFLNREESKINKKTAENSKINFKANKQTENNASHQQDMYLNNAKVDDFLKDEVDSKIFLHSFDEEEAPFLRKTNEDFWQDKPKRAIHISRNTTENSSHLKKVKQHKNKDINLYINSKTERIKNYLPIIMYQMVMLILLIGLSYYTFNKFAKPIKMLAGASIIWLLVNYFISKEILKFQSKKTKNKLANINNKKQRIKMPKEAKVQSDKRLNQFNNQSQQSNKVLKYQHNKQVAETELLYQTAQRKLYLKDYANQNILELNKKVNIIGRKYDEVDLYIDDKSIGRIHAAIILENNRIFLQDNDSLNGCYVNDIRLAKNSKIPIEIGDQISFSRCNYTLVYDVA